VTDFGKSGPFRTPAILGSIGTEAPLGTGIISPPNAERNVG
jgi:hypothetical protein